MSDGFRKSIAGGLSPTKLFLLVFVMVGVILFAFCSGSLLENLDADEVMVIQAPFTGKLTVHTTPGVKWQGVGKVTTYPRRSIYTFEIPVRFNDGGHATMHGSIQYEMPLDVEHLTDLHLRFGNREAIQKQLVETVVNKSVYMTGPLMSSKESYAERRNDLIYFVEDQVTNGVYKTHQRDERIEDPVTKVYKTVTVVDLVKGEDGAIQRQEDAVLTHFGIKPFNFSITQMPYDDAVEEQIKQQQQITMDVQTAIADAKKAEQKKITVEAQGAALAAEARWEQEKDRAKKVVVAEQEKEVAELAAQQRLEVAKLDREAAEQKKAALIAMGEGEAEAARLRIEADGALKLKLETWQAVMSRFAEALEKTQQPLVPQFVMGGGVADGNGTMTSMGTTQDFIALLGMKAMKDLAFDLAPTTKPSVAQSAQAVGSN